MRYLAIFVFLFGLLSTQNASATETVERIGEVHSNRIELSGVKYTDFSCDESFFECRYRINSLRKNGLLIRVSNPANPTSTRDDVLGWTESVSYTDFSSKRACEVRARIERVKESEAVDLVTETCCRPKKDAACFYSDEANFITGLSKLSQPITFDIDLVKEK